MTRNVLILTKESDAHMPPVAKEIEARGARVYSFNQSDFPEQMNLSFQLEPDGRSGSLAYQQQQIDLCSLTSIWRRRPKAYRASSKYPPGEQAYIEDEATNGFLGVLESLSEHVLWVSNTHHIRRAELKPIQLAMAQKFGLRIPRTIITNDEDAVRAFYEHCHGNIIIKSLGRGVVENEEHCIEQYLYTSKVEQEDLTNLEGVQVTAHQLQEYIPKRIEIRVIVIGKQVFAAEIHSQHSDRSQLDFRRSYGDLTYVVHQLSESLKAVLLEFVHAFHLQFSAMDFIITPQGEYVFLDLNPNGQWYWLQMCLGDQLPLKQAMANLLVYPEEYKL